MPAALAALGADVLCLQEVYNPEHKDFLARSLAAVLPYAAYSGRPTGLARWRLLPDSLMMLSRYPLGRAEFIRFEAGRWDEKALDTKGFMSVDLTDSPLGPLRVLNIHTTAGVFTHPEHPLIDTVRQHQLAQLERHTQARPGGFRAVLAGDFNCGPAVWDAGAPPRPLHLKGGLSVAAAARVSAGNYALLGALGWQDSHTALGLAEQATWHPTDNALNTRGDHAAWGCPPQRIDHLFFRPEELRPVGGQVILQAASVAAGSVHPLQKVPLSDHYGYAVTLAAASSTTPSP